ncbi:helix-turn-helix domain-containing protein [Pseudoxanthomonas winnipegensis]|jgi:transcriptional regulator with XRE-family HTH domain|uniref:helix-turn-helix domain-containing protein n=1 Tax=Pseudoxanthomonas winnipegensis TaxID=2480810 RepID=UPI001982486D|nr:helix-turn-helix transcriptional regulator [Pseudoxanthomonas winnipegensis]
MTRKPPGNVYGRRLREARDFYGFSQLHLAVAARLDESGASARISRYETGVHQPKLGLQQRLASVLALPTSYFYIEDDAEALKVLDACRSEAPLDTLARVMRQLGQTRASN